MNKLRLSRILAGWFILSLILGCNAQPSVGIQPGTIETLRPALTVPTATLSVPDHLTVFPKMTDDYLVNPGIGWQLSPGGFDVTNIPEAVAYSNRREIAWRILNPEEGIYDWSALDDQLAQAVDAGKQYSFRVYSMVGEPFDGHMVPDWVLNKGARILSNGEPDYSNCIYQDEWAKFVEQLIDRYDGNPDIAFIDISGYGNFNEWAWQDQQTEWDQLWADHYPTGTAAPGDFQTLDGQARRRLADMFIGGSFETHNCRLSNDAISTVSYFYRGFQKTQLVMPYAGIAQSTQYVFTRRKDVGFRFDCLGAYTDDVFSKVGDEISLLWKAAPVVYELCSPNKVGFESAKWLMRMTHGSLVHNNASKESADNLVDLVRTAGYRYFLKEASLNAQPGQLQLHMEWQNFGSAPNYPKMGQDFELMLYLVGQNSNDVVFEERIPATISSWMPLEDLTSSQIPVSNMVDQVIRIPGSLPSGAYGVKVGIIDIRTGQPILPAMDETDADGLYYLGDVLLR